MQKIWKPLVLILSFALVTGCSDDSDDNTPADPYADANGGRGGIMYDKFWSTEAGFDSTDGNLAALNAKLDFFRCKQCHGWDLLGANGSYINRGANASRPHVAPLNLKAWAASKTSQELFDGLKASSVGATRRSIATDLSTWDPINNATVGDQMPNLTEVLSDDDLWDIVKYLKEEAVDVSLLYDATYSGTYPTGSTTYANIGRDGNAANGATYYANNCAICHGANGTFIEVPDYPTVGGFLRRKPNEVHHKVKFGQLGSEMAGKFDITDVQMKDLYKALTDTVAFPD